MLGISIMSSSIHYFVLSSDVLWVITFPESLNGETGLVCSYLGGAKEFARARSIERSTIGYA